MKRKIKPQGNRSGMRYAALTGLSDSWKISTRSGALICSCHKCTAFFNGMTFFHRGKNKLYLFRADRLAKE